MCLLTFLEPTICADHKYRSGFLETSSGRTLFEQREFPILCNWCINLKEAIDGVFFANSMLFEEIQKNKINKNKYWL